VTALLLAASVGRITKTIMRTIGQIIIALNLTYPEVFTSDTLRNVVK